MSLVQFRQHDPRESQRIVELLRLVQRILPRLPGLKKQVSDLEKRLRRLEEGGP